jgi:hypothetical protein
VKKANLRVLLGGLADETRELVLALRNVVRRSAPEVEESILWGALSYHRPKIGGRVKGAVCQIGFKGGRVRLEFIHGIRLVDSQALLQGDRVSKRFIPIKDVADVQRPEIAALICQAATLDPTKWA